MPYDSASELWKSQPDFFAERWKLRCCVLAYKNARKCPLPVMGKLATMDTICSSFRPWLSCYGICLSNTPPNGRYRQLAAGHRPYCNSSTVRGLSYFVVFRRENLITDTEGHYQRVRSSH